MDPRRTKKRFEMLMFCLDEDEDVWTLTLLCVFMQPKCFSLVDLLIFNSSNFETTVSLIFGNVIQIEYKGIVAT